MKILVATEKPFAPAAVKGIKEVIDASGNEMVLLEKGTKAAPRYTLSKIRSKKQKASRDWLA